MFYCSLFTCEVFRDSFFPAVIHDWNTVAFGILEAGTTETLNNSISFQAHFLARYYIKGRYIKLLQWNYLETSSRK